ncbi:energy transducer TonB [Paraburkholderia sp. BR14262]|uniref:energy transducer TonB n=1 Tax=Paraburkholderia sp. BR14262 TaxID=3236999 RepID=UPI0034CDFA2B
MHISLPFSADREPAWPDRPNVRATSAIVVVAAIHAALLAVVSSSRNDPVPPAAEPRTITAELLSPSPVTAPAVAQSPPSPLEHRATSVDIAKPKVQPQNIRKPNHVTTLHETMTPSPRRLAATEPVSAQSSTTSTSTPAAPMAAAQQAAASSHDAVSARPTIALAAPQDISHLHCSIAQPPYPALSQRRGETGSVMVKFIVGLTGQPESVELKSGSGHDRLDEAALAAVRDSTCQPYLENGTPRRVPTSVPFVFALNN